MVYKNGSEFKFLSESCQIIWRNQVKIFFVSFLNLPRRKFEVKMKLALAIIVTLGLIALSQTAPLEETAMVGGDNGDEAAMNEVADPNCDPAEGGTAEGGGEQQASQSQSGSGGRRRGGKGKGKGKGGSGGGGGGSEGDSEQQTSQMQGGSGGSGRGKGGRGGRGNSAGGSEGGSKRRGGKGRGSGKGQQTGEAE